jgi:two-component sensor histidine kinase
MPLVILPLQVEAASTLAVVGSSHEPLLFLAADLTLIAASASFCQAFQIDPASISGRRLAELGAGEWALPQLTSLLRATASGNAQIEAYEIELRQRGHETRCLLLHARTLDDGGALGVRLLLAITDITLVRAEARKKDELIREKAILLQEVQHRVANSLQIIASVLMQSARRVQSEEARGYLRDAHHRVLSIAAVQRHLAASSLGSVELRPYFTELCESLGASMIYDSERVSIEVNVDNSVVDANTSVSLGLIITELVINALKHAFPEQRRGKICVDYRSEEGKWTLIVTDDGIGMPLGANRPKPGLGTGIVEALAKQLRGRIQFAAALPGTAFTLVHDEVGEAASAPLAVA